MPLHPFALAGAAVLLTNPGAPQADPANQTVRSCLDAVHHARAQAGLPDKPTLRDEAMLLAAVDKRIGGCRVLTMARNFRDIRPEPAPATTWGLHPAR